MPKDPTPRYKRGVAVFPLRQGGRRFKACPPFLKGGGPSADGSEDSKIPIALTDEYESIQQMNHR